MKDKDIKNKSNEDPKNEENKVNVKIVYEDESNETKLPTPLWAKQLVVSIFEYIDKSKINYN